MKVVPPINKSVQLNPENTFIKVWPASILAKRRTAKLTSLKVYDSTSIGTNKGINKKGVPGGRNKSRK